jgi:tetratricopeptide (TPR) repeat protein
VLGRYEEAIPALKRDLALTNNLWDHVLLVRDYTELGQEDAARAEAAEVERRSALNPNSALGYWALAGVMNYIAEPSKALAAAEKAMLLDPGNRDKYLLYEGFAYQGVGRYEDSITAYKGFLALHPDFFGRTLVWLLTILNSTATMPRGQRRRKSTDLTRSSM